MADVEDNDLAELQEQRSNLQEALASVGDLRRGSITTLYRSCGKPGCACATPGHPGHGPLHLLTKSVAGKTVTKSLPGPALEKAQREVAEYRRFKTLVDEFVGVSEQICEARPSPDTAGDAAVEDGQKRGSTKRSTRTLRGR